MPAALGKDEVHSSESTQDDSGGHSKFPSRERPQGKRTFSLLKIAGQITHCTIW